MAAATIARISSAPRHRLLKASVVIPDVIISSLITFVLLAALPTDIAFGYLAGMLVASILVASGRAEDLAVRILHAARRPTLPEELRLVGPLRLVIDRSGFEDLQVLIGHGDEPVSAAGHRHVILHREVLDAQRAGSVTDAQVATLIAHGIGRLQLGHPRLDLLVALWTLPWDFLRGMIAGVGRRLTWVPLVQFAWRTRLLVGTIAVVLEAQAGRWPSPIVIAVFITLSYLMPRCRHAWHQSRCQTADRCAAQLGLAEPLARFVRRLHPRRGPRQPPRPHHRHGATHRYPMTVMTDGPTPEGTATRAVDRRGPRALGIPPQ